MATSMADPLTFVPRPHPERRLVAAIAAIAVVCAGLWWSGALAPRLTAALRAVEADADAVGRGTLVVELRNDGPLAVRVRGVRVDDRGGPPVEIGPARIGGRPLVDTPGGARLPVGYVGLLELPYAVDCDRPGGYGADPEVFVRVRAPLGVTQSRPVRMDAVYDALSGGDESFDPGPLLCPAPSSFRTGPPLRAPD